MVSNKIPQHVQIKPGRAWIRVRISPASLVRVETIHFHIWSQHSAQEQWFDLKERWHGQHWLSLCDSSVKVCNATPMHWRAERFPFEPAVKLCEHSAAPATAWRSSTKAPQHRQTRPSPLWTPIQLDCFFVCLFHFGHTLPSQELICGLLQVTVWRWQTCPAPPPPSSLPPLSTPWSRCLHYPRCPHPHSDC